MKLFTGLCLLGWLLVAFANTAAWGQTTEICNNGIDDDGDNLVDCQDPDCPECNRTINCVQPNIYYLPSIYGNPSAGSAIYGSQDLILSTKSASAIVSVRTPDGSFSQQVVLSSATSTSLALPLTVVMSTNANTKERNKGLILQSDEPIQATYRLTPSSNQDLIALKGRAGLGYAFYAGSQTRLSTTANAVDQRHFASIMATEDNTTVTIRSPNPLLGVTNPASFSVSLNAGETYMVTSTTLSSSTSNNVTIAGTLITSNKPISVNSGSHHTYQPYSGNRDGGFDQLVPARLTGQQYVAVHGQNTVANSDYLFVVGIEQATSLTITGPAVVGAAPTSLTTVTIGPGQVFTYNMTNLAVNRAFLINSTKKVYAFQVSSVSANEYGMSILPTINTCTGSLRSDFFRNAGSTIEQAQVIIPTTALSSLQFNNQAYTVRGAVTDNITLGGVAYSVVNFVGTTLTPFNLSNTFTANQRFHLGVISGSSATGNFGYYSSYDSPVDVLSPTTNQPSSFYRAALVTPGQQRQHCLALSSCGSNNFVRGVAGGTLTGSISVDPTNNKCILYTMRSNAPSCSRDTIRVAVTNEFGAEGTVCLEFVNSNNDLDATITPANPFICRPTGATSLTATATSAAGNFTYRWITADQQLLTTRVISTTSTGQFRLTVTDGAGCQDTTSIVVVGDTPAIAFTTGSSSACVGTALPYSVSSTTGTYSWSITGGVLVTSGTTTSTSATIRWTSSGSVRVLLTSPNGCTAQTSLTVTVYVAPTLSTTAVSPICQGGSDGRISLVATGGTTPYQYAWSNGATTQNVSGLRAGSYSVTVTTANSCSTSSPSIALTDPPAALCPQIRLQKI
jgi:hypothetical protein